MSSNNYTCLYSKEISQGRLILLSCLFLLGSIGNTATCIYIHQRKRRNTANLLLKLIMSLFNVMLLCNWVYNFLEKYELLFEDCNFGCLTSRKWFLILWNAVQFEVVWFMVIIAVCRSNMVINPKKGRKIWAKRRIIFITGMITVISILAQVPSLFHYKVTRKNEDNLTLALLNESSTTEYVLEKTLANSKLYYIYKLVYRDILLGFVPIIINVVCIRLMLKGILKLKAAAPVSTKFRNRSFKTMLAEEYRLTNIFIIYVAFFTVCYTFFYFNSLLNFIMTTLHMSKEAFRQTCFGILLYNVGYAAIDVNAACSFIIYLSRHNKRKQDDHSLGLYSKSTPDAINR